MNRMNEAEMQEELLHEQALMEAAEAESPAEALEESITAQAQEENAQTQEELAAAVRAGIGELFEDGWTIEELTAFSVDPQARAAIAAGKSVARAANAYLRGQIRDGRRHGVPTARTAATSGYSRENPIERMTDEEFDAFSRRAQAAMMAGRRVRI